MSTIDSTISSIALLFPGQGSQFVGMGADFAEAFPASAQVFEAVDDALGEKLSRIIREGPEVSLMATENAQAAIMATSIAVVRAIESLAARPIHELFGCAAGHSLGEYSALTAFGALELADTARLLRLRGKSMQAAAPADSGSMAAILGLDPATLPRILEIANETGICDLANDNSGGQIVLSGETKAIHHAIEKSKAMGARRAIILNVSAPFHCRLMAPVTDIMAAALKETTLSSPGRPILTNVSACPQQDPSVLLDHLVRQVQETVRWRETLAALPSLNIANAVEPAPGRVLTNLFRRELPDHQIISVATPDSVRSFVETLDAGNQTGG